MDLEYGILGLVQGITEFLPVSSSGHLYLLEHFFDISENITLTILLHAATLLAVILYFSRDIWRIIQGFFCWVGWCPRGDAADGILGLKLLLATAVTAVLAIPLEPIFSKHLTMGVVATTLIFTGVLIMETDRYVPPKIYPFTWLNAALLGLVQAFTILPGVSRSGVTIAFLIIIGLKRREAARISFLLSIPTIAGAFVFSLRDVQTWDLLALPSIWIAAGVAFVAAIAMIHSMLDWVEGKWVWFSPYCITLGLVLLLFFLHSA